MLALLIQHDGLSAPKVGVQVPPHARLAEQPLTKLHEVGVERIGNVDQSRITRVQKQLQMRNKPRFKLQKRRAADEVSVDFIPEVV